MLLHKDDHFIYNCRVAVKLPNNVYLDTAPYPYPVEGMVYYSEDMRTKVEINFVETEKGAKFFLESVAEELETFKRLKATTKLCANGHEGYTMTYGLSREIIEEYTFAIPGETPALLDICLTQRKEKLSDPELYAKLQEEVLAGLSLVENDMATRNSLKLHICY